MAFKGYKIALGTCMAGLALGLWSLSHNASKVSGLENKIPQVIKIESKINDVYEILNHNAKQKFQLRVEGSQSLYDPNFIRNYANTRANFYEKFHSYRNELDSHRSNPETKKILKEREKHKKYISLGKWGSILSGIFSMGLVLTLLDFTSSNYNGEEYGISKN